MTLLPFLRSVLEYEAVPIDLSPFMQFDDELLSLYSKNKYIFPNLDNQSKVFFVKKNLKVPTAAACITMVASFEAHSQYYWLK